MLDYLKFLFKSTNHHGVHSPFVFALLTKCLYRKPKLSKDKLNDLVLKSVGYFNCKTILAEDDVLKAQLIRQLPNVKFQAKNYDLVVIKRLKRNFLEASLDSGGIHNDTMIIVQDLNKNREVWNTVIKNPKVTVSLDGFSTGILFIRKEQVKQHFTIRL